MVVDPAVTAAYLGEAGLRSCLRSKAWAWPCGAVRALDGVSLKLKERGILAVLGANGAGKTSLLRAISGLLRPAAGAIRVDGADLARVPVERSPGWASSTSLREAG